MKVGIVVDNYKLEKFKQELIKLGLTDFKTFPFKESTTVIQVMTPPNKVNDVKKMCQQLELHFKHSN